MRLPSLALPSLALPSLALPAMLAAAALAGCTAAGDRAPITLVSAYQPITTPAVAPPYPIRREGPRLSLELALPTEEAIPFVREIASTCWVPFLQAEAVFFDADGPAILLTGEDAPLLNVKFLPSIGLARITMEGPALHNPNKMEELLRFLTRSQRAGEVECQRVPA